MKEFFIHATPRQNGHILLSALAGKTITVDNILGIINKTTGKVLYTPLKYGKISIGTVELPDGTYQEIIFGQGIPIQPGNSQFLIKIYTDEEVVVIPTDYAKEATLSAASAKIGDCVLYDFEEVGIPTMQSDGFCAILDDGELEVGDFEIYGEHAMDYKVGSIVRVADHEGAYDVDYAVPVEVSDEPGYSGLYLDNDNILRGVTSYIKFYPGHYYRVTGIHDCYDVINDQIIKVVTYEELDPDTVTGLVMQAIEHLIQGNQGDPLIRDFFGIVETPDEEVMSETEAIGILEDTWLAVTGSAAPHTDDWDGSGSDSGSGSGSGSGN